MKKFARISPPDSEGIRTVLEVVEAETIEDRYHPDIVAQFTEVPAAVVVGSTTDDSGETWAEPVPVDPAPAGPNFRTLVSPVEFKMLFSPMERLAIRQAREYSGEVAEQKTFAMLVDDWWSIVDDPRLTGVDLALPQTQAGLDMLVPAGILTDERRAEIGLGMPMA